MLNTRSCFYRQRMFLIAGLWAAITALIPAAQLSAAEKQQGSTTYYFSISAQPLSSALLVFSHTTGIALLIAKKDLHKAQSSVLIGDMTPEVALQKLLADSGIGYKFVDPKTVSISRTHYKDISPAAAGSSEEQDNRSALGVAPLEETIVSARRRDEQLQKIPIPISVLTSETIDKADILNLQDIALRVPGLNISYFSIGQPSIHMRGIGSNDDGAALDNSVVVFLDDIYVGRISTIDINVLDLERIEVLRGPQGTLYGKNAIGGAINMVSALPRETPGAQLTASAGNLGYRSLTAKLTGPLGSEALLGRLSVSSRKRDGWQDNIILGGDKQHDDKNNSVRAKLLFAPRDDLEWYLAYDFSKDTLASSGRIPVVGRVPAELVGDTAVTGLSSAAALTENNQRVNGPTFMLPTDIFAALGGDANNATNGVSGFTDRNISGVTSRLTWAQPHYDITAITGYRDSQFEWLEDSTGLPADVIKQPVSDYVDETHRQFSQELRWSSARGEKINYLLGLYYLREQTTRREHFTISNNTAKTHQKNTSDSFALFGEANYLVSSDTLLTLGARYTYDNKKLEQQSVNGGSPAIILEDFELSTTANWRDVSPSASLSQQISDDIMLFARIARGFKNGGFQGAPSTREAAMREIDPETAWDYELGLKSQWYHDRLQLNIAGFYTRYNDLQVTQFKTVDNFGVFETSNAGSANLKGVEAEFILNLSERLEIGGNYAWLDARYDSFNDVQGRDFSGNRLRQAPEHSLSLNANYGWTLEPGDASFRLDYRYQSRSYQEPDNEVTIMPSFGLLDARLSLLTNNKHWEVSLWAKNLLDEQYISHLYLLGGNDYALYGTPRTVGISLRYSTLQ